MTPASAPPLPPGFNIRFLGGKGRTWMEGYRAGWVAQSGLVPPSRKRVDVAKCPVGSNPTPSARPSRIFGAGHQNVSRCVRLRGGGAIIIRGGYRGRRT